MLEHPWVELQVLIKEKWLTQKAFSSILWKKVSEVNELLKWKRNITIQRDYLLHQTLWTPIKYWILKQIDYDYSLFNIEESDKIPLDNIEGGKNQNDISSWATKEKFGWETGETTTQDSSKQSFHNDNISTPSWEIEKNFMWKSWESIIQDSPSSSHSEWQTKSQKVPIQESKNEDNEDIKNRAKIFRSF